MAAVFICNLMKIGRSSELGGDMVCPEHDPEVMREVDANETSVELDSVFIDIQLIESSILLPSVSVDLEYHDGWCTLKSPRIRVSGVVRRCSIED